MIAQKRSRALANSVYEGDLLVLRPPLQPTFSPCSSSLHNTKKLQICFGPSHLEKTHAKTHQPL